MPKLTKLAFALLFAAATAAAQVSFTINATVNAAINGNTNPGLFGYTAGQAVSFTWVLNNFAPTPPTGTVTAGSAASSNFEWADEHVTDTQLWSSFSGTGLTGTWHRAVSDINTPAITAELARWGRSAVPFNLIYSPGRAEPIVLPELLTPSIVSEALAKAWAK